MEVRVATTEDETAWDEYVLKHPDGLAYHQSAWKKAVKDAYGFDACSLLAEENGKILGILPLIDFKAPLMGRSLVSLPYCDVGGCLAEDEETTAALLKQAKNMGQQKNAGKVEIRQKASVKESSVVSKVRMVLELPDSSEELLAGFKSKLRSQVKKPGRDGLTAQLGGGELVSEFYQAFCENMRDLGSPVHSYKWIESIVKNYAENVRVGLVFTPEKELAAAGIILMNGDTVSIPWASSLRRYNRQNPNLLLYWTFLSFAADRGYRYFDFGRSTPGEGTYKFKEQWGAKAIPLEWFDLLHDSAGTSATSHKKMRTLVERVWRKMPLSFSMIVGPLVRRYISL